MGVVTAERFAGQRFAFGPWTVLTEHVPAIARAIGRELGPAGVLLLAAGLLAAIRARNARAALSAASAAGMLGIVLNISGDLSGFITPVVVLLWPFAALGADAAGSLVRGSRRPARLAATAALAVAAVMPVANVVRNYRTADQSDNTAPARFFCNVFSQIPDRAGVVVEDYYCDMALH